MRKPVYGCVHLQNPLEYFKKRKGLSPGSVCLLVLCYKTSYSSLLTSDFTAAAILISFGAVLGKTSALQLVVMAILEVILLKVNEFVGIVHFKVNYLFYLLFVA